MMMARVRRQRGNIMFYAAVVVLSVVVAFVIAEIVKLSDRADTAANASVERQEIVESLSADVESLRHQVTGLGEEPVAPDPDERTDDLTPIPGPQGERGPRGFTPSPQEVMTVVAEYLIENPPERGPAGADGSDGSDGESIVGPQGETGEPGESIVGPEGPQGEPGDSVTGPPGGDGSDGSDGVDGRGIVSVTIEGDGRESCELIVRYTDDTADSIAINPLICIRAEGES
jgi:hypothetical protein